MELPAADFRRVPMGGYQVEAVDRLVEEIRAGLATDPPTVTASRIIDARVPTVSFRGYDVAAVDDWLDLATAAVRQRPSGPTSGPTSARAAPWPRSSRRPIRGHSRPCTTGIRWPIPS